MANIINITERGNRLDITDTYTPIVCGNSNYELVFDFSDEWKECNNKTAVFFVNGKKTMVDFTGNVVTVPILPNAPYVHVALTTSNSANAQLSTTSLRLRLESTPLLDEMKEFDPLKNYLTSLLGTINSLESGDISVSSAKFAENVSNPNLLINGNFAVNQRGSTTYSCTGNTYTVDRWMGFSGLSVTKTDGGVTLSNTSSSAGMFQQKLENNYSEFANKTVALSAKINGEIFSIVGTIPSTAPATQINLLETNIEGSSGSAQNSLRLTYVSGRLSVNIYLQPNESLSVEFVKLEFGETATKFTPRLYAEELALCQRYYQVTRVHTSSYCSDSNILYFGVNIPTTIRTTPTLILNQSISIRGNNLIQSASDITYSFLRDNLLGFSVNTSNLSISSGIVYCAVNADLNIDAEIY